MRALAVVGYYVCWALEAGLVALVFGSILAAALDPRFGANLGVDDDWVLLVMPSMGAMLGVLAARRTRESPRLHGACLRAGLITVLGGVVGAVIYSEKAVTFAGTGMLAGMGELVISLFFVSVVLIGALLTAIGALGPAARRQSPSGE